MDLLQKNAKGTLDAMAACKLLWAGVLVLNGDDAEQESRSAAALNPKIDDSVISLYSISHEEVDAVVPDLSHLLGALEADDELRVESSQVSPAVLEALPTRRFTGASLFLLQSGAHPLIVESAGKDRIRIRYDKKLARGIPRLQDLLCRMACHLRSYNSERGSFGVSFVANDNRGNPCGIKDFEGCVDGAAELLDQHVEVDGCSEVERFYLQPSVPNEANIAVPTNHETKSLINATNTQMRTPDADLMRVASVLETDAYAIRMLADATSRRLKDYEATLERIEQAQPNAKAYKASTSLPSDLPTNARASRSLVLRSAFYIAIGIGFLLLGSRCITHNEDVSAQIMRLVDGAAVRALDFAGLVFGQFGDVGSKTTLGLSPHSLAGPIRIAGFVLMAIGILFPVRKILKHNRRLKRELAAHRSHVDYMSALVAKRQLNREVAYAQDLESWSAKNKELEADIGFARRSCAKLELVGNATANALKEHYASIGCLPKSAQNLCAACTLFDYMNTGRCQQLDGPDGAIARYREDLHAAHIGMDPRKATQLQPTLRTAVRSCDSLLRKIEAQSSEEKRHQLIAEQCDKVMTTLASTQAN